jgi:hypothetical protein
MRVFIPVLMRTVKPRHQPNGAALRSAGRLRQGGPVFGLQEFLLSALLQVLREAAATDRVGDQIKGLLKCLAKQPLTTLACMTE